METTPPVLLDLPLEITTERLLLRPPLPGDGAAHCAAVLGSLPELRQFIGSLSWIDREHTPQTSEAYARMAHADFLARRDLPLFIFERATGAFVGATGLHRTVWATPKTEIGYWVNSAYGGRGYVTEAVQAVTAYAFQHIKAVRVEIIADESNVRSRRVAERCGFDLECIARQERRSPTGLMNMCHYVRLAPAT